VVWDMLSTGKASKMASWCEPGKLRLDTGVTCRRASLMLAGLVLLALTGNAAGQSTAPVEMQKASPLARDFESHVTSEQHAHLRAMGVEYGFVYTGEVLSNASGGLRRGTIYDGKLEGFVRADLGKMAGWDGLTFYANAFQLHGTGRLRRDYVGNLITISNIEATPTTRLSELWLEQKLLDGALTVRAGQLAADVEFFFSNAGNFFANSDWPTIASANLPSGGPAYPLSTPGVRLKIEPTKDTNVLLAVFNGDPAGPGAGDEQERNPFGLNFRVQDPPFVIAEMQVRSNQDATAPGLASTVKLGAWVHLGRFDDQRFGLDGLSLASPSSSQVPLQHRANHGIYAVIDQQLYRPAGGDPNSGLVAYLRMSVSPSDRNLIQSYFEGGVIASGLIPARPDDKLGAAFIYAGISDAISALDRDAALLANSSRPIHDYEASLELSYQTQIQRGWTLQPLFQHIWHPSGSSAVRDATIVGVRTVINY
jgi:porin